MQEIVGQILIFLKGLWQQKRYIAIIAWIICPIGWYAVWNMPDQFKSSARVYVDTQSLLKPLLRGLTIQSNPDHEIRLMVKTLFSRPNLEKIARNADLDIQTVSPSDYEKLLANLKKQLKISAAGRENIYTLSYTSNQPDTAKDVVQATLSVFIENTLGGSRSDTDAVKSFLDKQIAEYEQSLLESEQKLAKFRQDNTETLQGSIGNFHGMLQQEKTKLEDASLQLTEAKTRLNSARAQLKGEEPTFGLFESRPGATKITTEYDGRIENLEQQLDQLSLKFTDQHPSVKELTQRIATLDEKRQTEIKEIIQEQAAYSASSTSSSLDANPVYQEMKLSVNRLETEVASLNVRVNKYKERVQALEAKVHTVPEIESNLTALNRGYEITKSKYNELLSRREQAKLSQKADLSSDDIQFKVIDPPRQPLKPSGPNRPLFLSIVTFLSIAVGAGVAFLLSQLNPVIFSTSQLPDYPVFGVVSKTAAANESTVASFPRRNLFYLTMIALLIGYASLMALQMIM